MPERLYTCPPSQRDTYRQWRTEPHTVGMVITEMARYRVAGAAGGGVVLTIHCVGTYRRVEISCIARARPRFFGCRGVKLPGESTHV